MTQYHLTTTGTLFTKRIRSHDDNKYNIVDSLVTIQVYLIFITDFPHLLFFIKNLDFILI